MDNKLNYRQNLFAEYYAEGETQGNATRSAIKAGYKETTAYSMGQRLLKHVEVKRVIDEKTAKIKAESIATRKKRQEFWSRIMNDSATKMSDRLRASELLGKSEADFTENYADKTAEQPEPLSEEEQQEIKEVLTELSRRKRIKLFKSQEGVSGAVR